MVQYSHVHRLTASDYMVL